MTFTERIAHRRTWGVWVFLGGLSLVGIMAAVLIFVMHIVTPTELARNIVDGFITLIAFVGGFITARFFADNIDGIVQEMGPIRRRLLVGAILEEAKEGGNMEEFIHPLTQDEVAGASDELNRRKPLEAKGEVGVPVNGRPFEKRDFRQELERWKQHRWFWEVIDDLMTDRPSSAANTERLLAQLVDALRSVEWSSAWIDKEEVVSMTREICPYCDYKKADGHQQGCKVGDALDAALRGEGKESRERQGEK